MAVHYYVADNKKEGISEGYDEEGKKIRNYVFQKDAEFKGGQKAWMNYLGKHVTTDLHVKGDGDITSSAEIEFIVDENGDVTRPGLRKSSGYKIIDNDALRVIAESPQWNYGILYNKQTKCYKIQPITYILKQQK